MAAHQVAPYGPEAVLLKERIGLVTGRLGTLAPHGCAWWCFYSCWSHFIAVGLAEFVCVRLIVVVVAFVIVVVPGFITAGPAVMDLVVVGVVVRQSAETLLGGSSPITL